MVDVNLRQMLPEECVVLDSPSFDNSIVGITYGEQRLIYSLQRMIQEFMEENECSFEEAQEFIEYNTARALPYMGAHAPVIMMDMVLD